MSFLNELFVGLNVEEMELLQERFDIVEHKIKFMEKIPVACLEVDANQSYFLAEEISLAGGMVEPNIFNAAFIIFYQPGKSLTDLMREVPAIINPDWQAAKNNRIVLLDDDLGNERTAENVISLIENLAEMLHPGSFIFGHEGDKWIRFSV